MATHEPPKQDIMKLSQQDRHLLGLWLDSELAEMHPGDAELPSFTVPSLQRLNLPKLYEYLQGNGIDACVVGALDKELSRIHRKVGGLLTGKHGDTSSVDPTTGCREFALRGFIKLSWQDYRLFTLAKAPGNDHVETVRFFMDQFPKRTGLGDDGSRKQLPAWRLVFRRKKQERYQQRRQDAAEKAREMGQAQHARNQERFSLRQKRKEMHERIKRGRKDGTMTSEEAKGLSELNRKKSQIVLLEARKQMVEQGLEPAAAEGDFEEVLDDGLGGDETFGYAEEMDEEEEMSSGDERQAPEPVLME